MFSLEVILVCLISLLIGLITGILEGFEMGFVLFLLSLNCISLIWYLFKFNNRNLKNEK